MGWRLNVGRSVYAGSLHQVYNEVACVKIAEDFVSPEHIGCILEVTDQFRTCVPFPRHPPHCSASPSTCTSQPAPAAQLVAILLPACKLASVLGRGGFGLQASRAASSPR